MTPEEMKARIEELENQNSEMAGQLEEVESIKEQSEAYRKKAEGLEKSLKGIKKKGIVSLPVEGSFEVTLRPPKGKQVKKTLTFKPGRLVVLVPPLNSLPGLAGASMKSEALLRIANGKEATEEELRDFPAMGNLTKALASEILHHYAAISAGFIELK